MAGSPRSRDGRLSPIWASCKPMMSPPLRTSPASPSPTPGPIPQHLTAPELDKAHV